MTAGVYRNTGTIVSAVGSGAGIEKATLILVFAGTALNWTSSYVFSSLHVELPEWVVMRFYLYICVPALALSLRGYLQFGGFAKTPAVFTCVILLLLGLLWTPQSELGRGALKFAAFAVTVPMASLLVKHDYSRQCMWAFVLGTVASLVLVLALDLGAGSMSLRFGNLIDDTGRASGNPNSVGAQAALATCLVVLMFLQKSNNTPVAARRSRFAIAYWACLALFLVYFVLLTASRTAFIALAGTLIWIAVFRFRRSPGPLILSALTVVSVLSILWAADSVGPETNKSVSSQMQGRLFQDEEGTVRTLGSRTLIWKFAGDLLTDDYRWVLGFGTGGADQALGSFFELGWYSLGADGIRRLHSHSTFIEWALMFGLVGATIPIWLAIRVLATGWRMDHRENSAERTSLISFAILFSFGGVINTEVFWVAFGTLLWAMLSCRPPAALRVNSPQVDAARFHSYA